MDQRAKAARTIDFLLAGERKTVLYPLYLRLQSAQFAKLQSRARRSENGAERAQFRNSSLFFPFLHLHSIFFSLVASRSISSYFLNEKKLAKTPTASIRSILHSVGTQVMARMSESDVEALVPSQTLLPALNILHSMGNPKPERSPKIGNHKP